MRVQVLIVEHGRVLMQRRWEDPAGRAIWGLPRYRARDGEAPEQALERALAEEAGLVVEIERLLVVEERAGRGRQYTFAARLVDGEVVAELDLDRAFNPWRPALGIAWRPLHPETVFSHEDRKYLTLAGLQA